jgi:hypothetical protein
MLRDMTTVTPHVGLLLVNPKAGTTTVFIATAESTGGDYVEVEVTYPPDSPPPPRHLHPSQDEHVTTLSTGELFCALWECARDHDWEPDGLALFEVITRFGDEFCLC